MGIAHNSLIGRQVDNQQALSMLRGGLMAALDSEYINKQGYFDKNDLVKLFKYCEDRQTVEAVINQLKGSPSLKDRDIAFAAKVGHELQVECN